jgi:hypothetical protein
MAEQIIPWFGLSLLAVLCLPLPAVRRLVLGLTAVALRLGLIAVLGGAAYLWFRPTELPAAVLDVVSACPRLLTILPDLLTPNFGIALAAVLVGTVLPVLAIVDACRAPERVVERVEPRPAAAVVEVPVAAAPVRTPPARPAGRAAAADAITAAGARPARTHP